VTCSGKFRLTVQLLSAVVPLLVTLTSTWKKVPPVFEGVAVQLTAPPLDDVDEELLLDELELEELLLDEDELLLDDELELLEELDEDELLEELLLEDELLELDEELEPEEPLIEPADAVKVTRSSLAPSSRRTIRSVCAPAERLLKVAGVTVP
jgi:hypothetical protein